MKDNSFFFIDDDGSLKKFSVQHDKYAQNPRITDTMVGTMNLSNGYGDPCFDHVTYEQSIIDFIVQRYDPEKVFEYINQNIDDVEVARNDLQYYYCKWETTWNNTSHEQTFDYGVSTDDILKNVLEVCLSEDEIEKVLFEFPKDNLLICPVFEYSDTNYSLKEGKYINNNGSVAGFIYCDFADYCFSVDENASLENWKENALKILEAEVDVFSSWTQGNVYKYVIEKGTPFFSNNSNKIVFDWDITDPCGGFYSHEYGEDLIKEIANSAGYKNVIKFNEIPKVLQTKITAEKFSNHLEILFSQSPKEQNTPHLLFKALIKNMDEKEQKKLSSLLKKRGCVDEKSTTEFVEKLIKGEKKLIPQKENINSFDRER